MIVDKMIIAIGPGFFFKIIFNKKYPATTKTNIFIAVKDGLNVILFPSKLYGNRTSANKVIADEQMRAIATPLIPPSAP